MTGEKQAGGEIIGRLSAYVAVSGETELPREVIHKAKHHILDTLGAIVCGSNLKPGLLAKRFVAEQGGGGRSAGGGLRRCHHGGPGRLCHGDDGPFRRDRRLP
ncbi:MAG: hypothetical protein Q8K00_12955 [Syntrophales bacterium]|nr:hypothetical protein [Syntrophales bacterium]